MRIFFFLILITLLSACATVEMAKEITKATESIKTSIEKVANTIDKNKKILEVEKKQEKELVKEQKKIVKTDFLQKTLTEIETSLGVPGLSRIDGNTQITRFDTNNCRLFLFSKANDNIKNIKHFELRNTEGMLIIEKNKIQNCYSDFKLS